MVWLRAWQVFYLLVFVLPLFGLAVWIVLGTAQPLAVKMFGAALMAFVGAWNFRRGRAAIKRLRGESAQKSN
jgi:hypothetical protein